MLLLKSGPLFSPPRVFPKQPSHPLPPPTSPSLQACLPAGAGGGCAGREYELPGRQELFCLEGCCQHSEDG